MRIHPLSTEPFTPPTDRDMAPSERRTFVRTHRTCVFGTARLHRNDQAEPVTHWVSATLPWDAADDHEGARA
jgi:hypothetical protein